MEIIYYTLVGAGLYFISDWILNQIETRRGKRFQYRTIVFFVIILVLAFPTFKVMEELVKMYSSAPPPPPPPIPTEPPQTP